MRARALAGSVVVDVDGALDLEGSGALRDMLTAVLDGRHGDVVADLSGVTFIDSTGLGVLLGASKVVSERGGCLRLVVDDDRVAKVLRVSGLWQLFEIRPALDEALGVPPRRSTTARASVRTSVCHGRRAAARSRGGAPGPERGPTGLPRT